LKRTNLILVAALLSAIGFSHYKQAEFKSRSKSAAGAIFLTEEGKRRFVCSGTLFAHIQNGDGLFLTARHCVYQDADPEEGIPASFTGPEEVSFSSNEQGPFYKVFPYKVSNTDDVAILEVVNGQGLPTVRLGDEHLLQAGDPLTNYTYAMDFGKMPMELRAVAPSFEHLPNGLITNYAVWTHSMPVNGFAAPGSSGSGLFDSRQRALVGIVVAGSPRMSSLTIAIPVSRVWNLLSDTHSMDISPKASPEALRIPDDVFKLKFGKEHTFTLIVHGADPQFTQAGYTFKAVTDGFELSDDFYYKVPVYIDMIAGEYRLTSTKEGASVQAIIVAKAE
jgi:hypothetical protein